MDCPTTSALAGILGVFIGLLVGHYLTISRERYSRRRDFRNFLTKWRSEVLKADSGDVLGRFDPWVPFNASKHAFESEFSNVKFDFFIFYRHKFNRLADNLRGITKENTKENSQKRMLEAIDNLIKFCS